MRKILFLWVLCCCSLAMAQTSRGLCSVAFYNLENLFDTIHDVGKNDADFLPDGRYQWNSKKYQSKLRRMARVLGELGREKVPQGPALIGLAEIENSRVLADLVHTAPLQQYRFVHYEGPDRRGIDCALLYDPMQFVVERSVLVPSVPFEGDTAHLTRGFLVVEGCLHNEKLCVVVNHWPSRGAASCGTGTCRSSGKSYPRLFA